MWSASKETPFRNLKLSYYYVTHSLVPVPWILSKLTAHVTDAPKYYVWTSILIKNLHISLIYTKCIKSLIKQVKQFTAGTVWFVRITIKPVQQLLRKLQIYNIERQMTKCVWSCNQIAETQSSLQKAKTFLIFWKVYWKSMHVLCPSAHWWPEKNIKNDQKLSLSSVCVTFNMALEKDFTQSLWTTTKGRFLWKNIVNCFKQSS